MKHVSWVIALVVGFAVGFFGRGALDVNRLPPRPQGPVAAAPGAPGAPAPSRPAPPREDPKAVYRLPVDDTPTLGPADALVTIVESSDYQCPFCKRASPTVKQIQEQYSGRVRFSFRHNPLAMHPMAMPAAIAAEEVRVERGDAKFWEVSEALFALQAMDVDSIVRAAVAAGADGARVRAAMDGRAHQDRILRDQALVTGLGAGATPTFFVNGRKLEGAQPFETFRGVIDEELAKAQAMVKGGIAPRDVYARIMASAATTRQMLAAGPEAPAPTPAAVPGAPPAAPPPPPSEFRKVPLRADDPARGPKDAKLTLVLFSDFQCPFCSRVEPTLKQLEESLKGQIRIVWKHEPLPMHPNAMPAAQASEAAREQGKFWEMHEKMFANQTALDADSLARYAREVGLDMGRYQAFVSAGKGTTRISEDQALASSIGANGTPNMFFNCRQVVGARPFEQLKAVADEEIKKVDALLKGARPDAGTYERACDDNVSKGAAYAQQAAADAARALTIRPDDPVKGSASAPVTIVLFSDFQCPFCSRLLPSLQQVEQTYGNRVKIVWKHMPLPPSMHPQAQAAAEAAEAAREQGKFWQMHDKLFASQRDFGQPDVFARIARDAGLDLNAFQASLASGKGRQRVLEDQSIAQRMGVQATPTMMINGEKLEGAVGFDVLKSVIDRKLSAAR